MTIFTDIFLLRGLLAAISIAAIAGPLGCFILWRKMAYLGDAAAHASLLGIAFAMIFSLPIFSGVVVIVALVAVAGMVLAQGKLSADSVLGVLAHSGLALGIIALALAEQRPVDLHSYLFGEVLAVSWFDVGISALIALTVAIVLYTRWPNFVTVALSSDLASAAGINARKEDILLSLLFALIIAASIKIVGALLITALLILPAAAARFYARTPERMAIGAAVLGLCAVLLGFWASDTANLPTGPTIISAAALIFAIIALFSGIMSLTRQYYPWHRRS